MPVCPTLLKSIQNENNKNIYLTSILSLYYSYVSSILSLYYLYLTSVCFCFQLTPPTIATNIALFLHTGQCGPKHFLNVQTKRFNRLRIKVMKKAKEECRGKNKGYPTLLKSIQNENNENIYFTAILSLYYSYVTSILVLCYLYLTSVFFLFPT